MRARARTRAKTRNEEQDEGRGRGPPDTTSRGLLNLPARQACPEVCRSFVSRRTFL